MNTRRTVKELRDKIEKYRAMARLVSDPEVRKSILELTDDLEQQARDIEMGK